MASDSGDSTINSDIQLYFPKYESVKSYTQDVLKTVVAAARSVNNLPACGDEFGYYNSFSGFQNALEKVGGRIQTVMSSLTKGQGICRRFGNHNAREAFDLLIEANDVILENFDLAFDETIGKKVSEKTAEVEELVVSSPRGNLPINASWNKASNSSDKTKSFRLLSASNILRPQLKFKEKIDNSNSPFVPIIKDKPNSIKPLAILPERVEDRDEFGHPYEWEIEKFQPSGEVLEASDCAKLPKLLDETPLVYVENDEDLVKMCEELRNEKELAIDLEHHSYRSFQGIVCLMQISTHEKDYIVDTLKLRLELQVLNEIFTDPKVVKVLHGADMDIIWLQRDFGLYIVNMFDTGQAARTLNFPRFSLGYLLKHYCNMDADKQYQLADWRMRPLLPEMIKYAREDTHYLLYIYECMKNDLLQKGNDLKNLLLSVYQRSKTVCLQKYEKTLFEEDSYLTLYRKSKKAFNSRQLFALKEIFSWRDRIAREEDESLGYILPDHMLLQMAENLPREQQGILACCNPVPMFVRQEASYLHSVILNARESSVPAFLGTEQKLKIVDRGSTIDLENVLHCHHDIHQSGGFSGGMDVEFLKKKFVDVSTLKQIPSLPVFNVKEQRSNGNVEENVSQDSDATAIKSYLSPYMRFNLEKIRSSKKPGVSENGPISDSSAVDKTHIHLTQLSAAAAAGKEENPIKVENNLRSVSSPLPNENENSNIEEVKPLRQKEKRRRKRKSRPEPDVSLVEVPAESSPPKIFKIHKIDDAAKEEFKPFDYSAASSEIFEDKAKGKTRAKKDFNPEDDLEEYKRPGKNFGKRRKQHSKQTTFSQNREKGGSSGSINWPKR